MMTLIAVAALAASPGAAPAPSDWCSVAAADARALVEPLKSRLAARLNEPPHALAHVHTEHTLSGDPGREASLVAERDLPLMRDAALAWRAGAGDVYGVFAVRYLTAWVTVYQPDLNPIDETNFDALVQTWAILRSQAAADERVKVDGYFRAWGQAYVDSIRRGRTATRGSWTNNWQSHRVKLVAMMAAAIDDAKLFGEARRLFREQLDVNVAKSGEVIDFSERDALHYVTYDLEPLLQAALAARSRGEDWFHPLRKDGPSLEAAVRWLRPYAAGEKTHQEFVRSTVRFDAERAQHGEAGYSGQWEPKTAARVYWLASRFDPAYQSLALRLGPAPTYLALCGQ